MSDSQGFNETEETDSDMELLDCEEAGCVDLNVTATDSDLELLDCDSDQEFLDIVESTEHCLQSHPEGNELLTHPDYLSLVQPVTSSSPAPPSPFVLLLPDDALYEILAKIPSIDQQTFLNFRLVCVQWNQLIENTSMFMRNITFPIWHPKPFLDLPIVQRGKVRSICFKNCTGLETDEITQRFFEAIQCSVEKVQFTFEVLENSLLHNQLFKLVLENCTRLQELIVQINIKNYQLVNFHHGVFRGINPSTNVAAGNKIKVLSVDMNGVGEEDSKGLAELLLKLPRLREISFAGTGWGYAKVFKGLCDYLKKYDKAMHLKKISLHNYKELELAHRETFFLLLILCGKHQIIIEGLPNINFNYLLTLEESELLPRLTLRQNPLFPSCYKLNSKITIAAGMGDQVVMNQHREVTALANTNRLQGLTVRDIKLTFVRDILRGELSWLHQIHGLESLTLETVAATQNVYIAGGMAAYLHQQQGKTLSQASTSEYEFAFSNNAATTSGLRSLKINHDIFRSMRLVFGSGNSSSLSSEYFPNLVELEINNCEATPNYLIRDLIVLQKLQKLVLTKLRNLKDIAFTAECSTNSNNPGKILQQGPAIACFNALKILEIYTCHGLTNLCIEDGISKCKTLEKLFIRECAHLTKSDCRGMPRHCDVDVQECVPRMRAAFFMVEVESSSEEEGSSTEEEGASSDDEMFAEEEDDD